MSIISQDDTELSVEGSLTAELRDGQLQIVEVGSFEGAEDEGVPNEIRLSDDDGTTKYVQVMDTSGKGLMHLDFVNLTLVRCGDGENSYRLVTNEEQTDLNEEYIVPDNDATVTCILEGSDEEEQDSNEYVMVEAEESEEPSESYVMFDNQVYRSADLDRKCVELPLKKGHHAKKESQTRPQTTLELLERAKALRKAKMLLKQSLLPQSGRGRRRKHYWQDPQELLESPKFKLFLYSCKQCQFKCNAIKELTAHRSTVHGAAGGKGALGGARRGAGRQFQVFVHESQTTDTEASTTMESESSLMCSACGFETRNDTLLAEHVLNIHGGE